MKEIKTVIISAKGDPQEKAFSKAGKTWAAYQCGIKIDGSWHNALLNESELEAFKSLNLNEKKTLVFWEASSGDKVYKNWGFPKAEDLLEQKVDYVTKFVKWYFTRHPEGLKEFLDHLK